MMIPLESFHLAEPVLAYLDPGTGSIILQAVVGIVLGAVFAIRMFWSRICMTVSGIFGKGGMEKDGEDETEHSG